MSIASYRYDKQLRSSGKALKARFCEWRGELNGGELNGALNRLTAPPPGSCLSVPGKVSRGFAFDPIHTSFPAAALLLP